MRNPRLFSMPHLLKGGSRVYFFKDSVHGSVNFERENHWLYDLVNTQSFWRLHGLRQMYFAHYNFPSATHTRFEHCLGVYELCRRFVNSFVERGELDRERDRIAINIALGSALLHDIGHGPLSHVFESIFPDFDHEAMAVRIIGSPETGINRILAAKSLEDGLPRDFYATEISNVLEKRSSYRWIVDLISSNFDVDRLDYLLRDSLHSGVMYGGPMDVDLFIKWSQIREGQMVFSEKIKNGLFHFLQNRILMYRDLYGNTVNNEAEDLFVCACQELKDQLDWMTNPGPMEWNIPDFLALNDALIVGSVRRALETTYTRQTSRDLLGWIFGLWLDEEGNQIPIPNLDEVKERLNGLMEKRRVKRNFESRTDETVTVSLLDRDSGRIIRSLLSVKCETFDAGEGG